MSTGVVLAYDATGGNYRQLPPGQHAGYVTGSGGIAWSEAMWAGDPGAVRIDQSPLIMLLDERADVIDFENGAATLADLVPWVRAAQQNFISNARPGQRRPVVYCSASSATDVVNELISGGITSRVGLWVAHFDTAQASAAAAVLAGSGPWPVIGFQFSNTGGGGTYDIDIFSAAWLSDQSGVAGNTVIQGSSGPAVASLQQRLNVWGAGVTADGLFGPGTFAALQRFQAAATLAADGVAGPVTWQALDASPVPLPPRPPAPLPAPLDLRQRVRSTAGAATFAWGAVGGVSGSKFQLEYAKPGFGWVLVDDDAVTGTAADRALAAATAYRWRVTAAVNGTWSPWTQFTTP